MDKSSPSIDLLGRIALALGIVLLCVAFLGCAPPTSAANGQVTLDGRPLSEAVIVFIPLHDGARKTGAEVVAGRYELPSRDGLRPGCYRVEFIDQPVFDLPAAEAAHRAHDNKISGDVRKNNAANANTAVAAQAHARARQRRRELPARYTIDSPLSIEFVAGRTTYDFALTTQPED
jgi:hypothetical protein